VPGRRQHGEGSVYQRSRNGQWVAVADLGRKPGRGRDRREFTGRTPTAAMARREEFLNLRRGGFTLPRGRPPTVSEWVLHWVHNIARAKVEATTWHRSYRQKIEELVAPHFHAVPLAELDEEMIEAWHAELLREISPRTGQPRSASTITQAHRIFSVALNVAVARKKMPRNPVSMVAPPKADEPDILPPEDDDVLEILKACEDRRTGPRWVTGIATGMRQGEILGMLWPMCDLADPAGASIDVQWELARIPYEHGCGDPAACSAPRHRWPCSESPCPKIRPSGRRHSCARPGDSGLCEPGCSGHASSCPERTGGLVLKRPKSARSRRQVPLPPYAAAELAAWRKIQKEEKLAAGSRWGRWHHLDEDCPRRPRARELVCPGCSRPARPGLLVWTQPSGLPVDARQDWGDWSGLLGDAGVEHSRIHDGRHYVATALLEDGHDVRVVQEIMGHSTPDFTRRQYQHVRVKLKRDAADAMERRMRGGGRRPR
jgi:integrase